MQLKKIIMKGFKSFPEKTTLEFDEGVTAIVGPNGSGKSNIIEAIRWVMGEQSAKTLRGDRMYDVIFSGTKERKPLNIAEVEIILDNSDDYLTIDYEEVSVLRRISRSGESTYMINQNECRLKDIVDLFMDSGLGKESFSIISQGQVEAVFNSKPEDRRGIFEEAAGVFKYKVRKKDAEKKLMDTQENLDRVQDIIYELESQLQPLRKQADIAKTYLNQKEKLTDLDIGVTVWQIKELLANTKDAKEKLTIQVEEINSINMEMQELEAETSQHQDVVKKLEADREELNRHLLDVVRQVERTEAALLLFDEKARHHELFVNEKEDAIHQIQMRLIEVEKKSVDIRQEYDTKNIAYSTISDEIAGFQKDLDYLDGDREAQIEELRNYYIDLLQNQTSTKNEINHIEQELIRSKKLEEKDLKSINDLKTEVQKQEASLSNKKNLHAKTEKELKRLLSEYQSIYKEVVQSKESMLVKMQRLNRMSNDVTKAKARQSSLMQMQENYEGYYAGVRSVMNNKQHLNGIIGTVAELVQIPKKYIQAIDTVLSSSGQFIVVENEEAGRDAINYLKQSKSGRATFLPLTTIQSRHITSTVKDKIKNLAGYVGIAHEIISYEPNIQAIVENLLGQTIVADSLEAANTIARAIRYKNRVVTLEGDIINSGGSMTGGGSRYNNTNPIFSQKTELATLTNFIEENEKVVTQLIKKQKQDETDLSSLEEKLHVARERGEIERLTEQKIVSEIEHLHSQLERLERELKATTYEASDRKAYYEDLLNQKNELTLEIEKVSKEVKHCQERMKLLTSEREEIEAEKNRISEKISTLYETRNTIREELASIRTNLTGVNNQISEYHEQMTNLKTDLTNLNHELEYGSKNELEKQFSELSEKQKMQELQQTKNKEKLVNINKKLEETKRTLTTLSGRSDYLRENKSLLEVDISKNDVRLDHNLNYLVEEYKIGYEEASLMPSLDISIEDAQKQVRLLKKGIEELGPVNLSAIEEYDTIHERYTFLTNQQNDLIEAKANLYNTMDEMDAIVETQFKETFNRIQKEFSLVFPKMFGGGYAELLLNDPDNLLETGIEIIAQPPGKRLTRLSLLSGGERALTAISLLFAIIQVNPIPFCILDEAEAALDDANVDRFGRYLEDFDYNTQFIVITHRKGTMEHANQLYGITMQEKGISKIVSVSLREAQEFEGVN